MSTTDMTDDELTAAWAAGELRVVESTPETDALFRQMLDEEDAKNRNCEHEIIDVKEGVEGIGGLYAVCDNCGLELGKIDPHEYWGEP